MVRGLGNPGAVDIRLRAVAVTGGAIAARSAALLLIGILLRIGWVVMAGGPDAGGIAPLGETPARRADTSILLRTTPFRPRLVREEAGPIAPTTLALTLHGIRDQTGASGVAIISDASGKQRLYSVGEQVGEKARIVGIASDHVVLSRAGRLETLFIGPHRTAQAKKTQRWRTRAVTLERREARRALLQLGLGRAEGGGGITVYPPLNAPVFARLGIRRGDIITAVGGVRIHGESDLAALLGESGTESLQIDLEREGRKHRLLLRMTDGG